MIWYGETANLFRGKVMFQIPQLKSLTDIIHDFSTVEEGNVSFKFGSKDKVVENRKNFLKKLGINFNLCVCLAGQHTSKVSVVNKSDAGKGMKGYENARRVDGLITKEKGLFLFMLAADCLPITIYDPVKKTVGLVHAGWRGTDKEVAAKTVIKLKEEFDSSPENLIIGLGPAALKKSYLKANPSQIKSAKWKPHLKKEKDELYRVDFVGFCKKQLIMRGVKRENIFESKADTIKDLRFFSHYRDSQTENGDSGRFACVIGMKV